MDSEPDRGSEGATDGRTVCGPDPDHVEALRSLKSAISATVRAGRARLELSQRELAERAGLPHSTVARLEDRSNDPRLSWIVAALAAVDASLNLPDAAQPLRMHGEYARDEAGRRLPAHLSPYRLDLPHTWWPGVTDILMWPYGPKWSYRRR
jgi:transcriptional regulator with XRE-family HTH domain